MKQKNIFIQYEQGPQRPQKLSSLRSYIITPFPPPSSNMELSKWQNCKECKINQQTMEIWYKCKNIYE